ncbi:MAG: hypothetical protein RSB23_06515 [Alistipes sp.]
MKIKLSVLGLFLATCIAFVGCSNDNDGEKIASNRERVLLNKYPNASAIIWGKSKNGKYDIATFTLSKGRAAAGAADQVTAWFGQGSDDIRLVDQEITFAELPTEVQTKFNETRSIYNKELYGDKAFWTADDVYKLERDGVVSYKIEADGVKVDVEMDLYFDVQGILLKEVQDTEESNDDEEETPLEIPENVAAWITTNHPNAEILDYDVETENGVRIHELDLKEQNIIMEVRLTETATGFTVDIEKNFPNVDALPQDILAKLKEVIAKQTTFVIGDIEDIEMVNIDEAEVYTFEFEKDDVEAELEIAKNSDGTYVVGDIEIEEEEGEEED